MTDWLRSFGPAAPGAGRLVCFPHAGGAASYYRPLADALGPGVATLAVQYPGHQDRWSEPAVRDLRVLASRVADALAALPPAPLVFFGHSMGALVAFETALLRESSAGHETEALFVSAARAPMLPRTQPLGVSDAALLDHVRMLGGTAPQVLADPDLRALALRVVRGDVDALRTYAYRPGAVVRCAVTALVGDDDLTVSAADAESWGTVTTGPFRLRRFPGGHFYVMDERVAVAALIRSQLGLPAQLAA